MGIIQMKSRSIKSCLLVVILLLTASLAGAQVDWNLEKTLKIKAAPLDVAVSADGKFIFVLTEGGRIQIFSPDGTLKDTINVGQSIERIKIGPRTERLFALNRREQTVAVIRLNFVKTINTAGAPYLGPANAPVVIAEFSDFQ